MLVLSLVTAAMLVQAAHSDGSLHPPRLGFIENRGQMMDQNGRPNGRVRYLLHGATLSVQLRETGFSYDLVRADTARKPKEVGIHVLEHDNEPKQVDFHRVDLDLVGADPEASWVVTDTTKTVYNFYAAGTPDGGITGVREYGRVLRKNVYPDIDLEFLVDPHGAFKYNFIVHHGGDLTAIRIRVSGPDAQRVTEEGIVMSTRFGPFTETLPACYTTNADGQRNPTEGRFISCGSGLYGISCDSMVPMGGTLVLDPVPVLMWCSYFGNNWPDGPSTNLAVDEVTGRYVLAGSLGDNTGFPTVGAFQGTYGGDDDGYVVSIDPSTNEAWATYYGGSQTDHIFDVGVAGGKVVVVGSTRSTGNIGYNTTTWLHGELDGFMARFDLLSGMLEAARYYGGLGWEAVTAIAVHDTMAYVVGNTQSNLSISNGNSNDATYGGAGDGFMCAFSINSLEVFWGTYVRGSAYDQLDKIAFDGEHGIYACGFTESADGLATPDGLIPTKPEISLQVNFMVKFDPQGNKLLGSYFPMPFPEFWIYDIASRNDELFLCGTYNGATYAYLDPISGPVFLPTDSSSYQPYASVTVRDAVYAHLDPQGAFLGCTNFHRGGTNFYGISVTDSAQYAVGVTQRAGKATCGAMDEVCDGGEGILVRFSATDRVDWVSYFGTYNADDCHKVVAIDDRIHVSGATNGEGLATPDAYQPTYEGASNNLFLATFQEPCDTAATPGAVGLIEGPDHVCQGDSAKYTIAGTAHALCYDWSVPPDAIILSGQGTDTVIVQFGATNGWVRVTPRSACRAGESTYLPITIDLALVTVSAVPGTLLCPEQTYSAVAVSDYPIVWSTGDTTDTLQITQAGSYFALAFHPAGCTTSSDTIVFEQGVPVNTQILPGNNFVDPNSSATYPANGNFGAVYTWEVEGGEVTSTGLYNVTILWGEPGLGLVTLMEELPGQCPGYDTVQVLIGSVGLLPQDGASYLVVHPNPSTGAVRFTGLMGNEEGSLVIQDVTGREVERVLLRPGAFSIDLSLAASGTYLFTLREGQNVQRKGRVVVL